MNNTPSTEERVWAALSHLSALAFGMGLLLPVIGWSQQRNKSKYAAFQCLQALGYQSLGYTVWTLSYFVLMIFFMIIILVLLSFVTAESGEIQPVAMAGFNILLFLFIFLGFGLYFLFPVIAAISCALGRDFRYPIMGNRLAHYLKYDPAKDEEPAGLKEEHEDRWVSAMGHFCVIIPMWGLMAPFAAWVTEGKRSPFLKFQSAQSLLYQGCVMLLSFLPGIVYLFGFMILLLTMGVGSISDNSSSMAGVGVIFLVVFGLMALVLALLIPLFHILGQWAGYRVLKGDDFRYPLAGRLVERWMASRPIATWEQPEQKVTEDKPI